MKTRIWIVFGLISIVLGACVRPDATPVRPTLPPGPSQTWIDAPLDNATLPLHEYKLVFHGASFVGITEFEIKINGNAEAVVPPLSTGSGGSQYGTLFLAEYNWNPPSPGEYLIQVRAKGNGVYTLPDQVKVFIASDGFEPANPTPAAEEAKECTFTAEINQFCRLGPSMGFEAIDNFIPGQSAPVLGESTEGLFWYVLGPNYGGLCTVSTEPEFGAVNGDCEILPRFTPMPPPPESPLGCTIRQAGGAIICVAPCPAGAAPGEPCTP